MVLQGSLAIARLQKWLTYLWVFRVCRVVRILRLLRDQRRVELLIAVHISGIDVL